MDPVNPQLSDEDVRDVPGASRTFDDSTLVLGIETSCDETAAALVLGGYDVVSSVVSTQVDLHADFGGVVPEIASRAHLDVLNPVIARAIVEAGVDEQRIDAVACTVGPGLIGALLVGVSAAKALAMAWDVPFVGVNHMEAHLYAASLEDPTLEFPLIVLLVSGGHTMLVEMQDHGRYRLVGQTIDDAAGEAFDKVARFLDLGYPGGPAIDRAALDGDPEAIRFPRAIMDEGYDFSFSGLKTAVVNYVRKHPDVSSDDVAASFQAAVVDVLVTKARRAAAEVGATGIVLGGGVAANSLLREELLDACEVDGIQGFLPSRAMCTDNAAMIAAAGWHRLRSDGPTPSMWVQLPTSDCPSSTEAGGPPWSAPDTVVRVMSFRIGQFELSAPVVLAPMAGVTNAPFRTMCREFAPGLVYVNEMVMATPVVHANAKTDRMISFAPDEHPRSLQLYGSDPDTMGRAVAKLCDAGRVDHIDINFGCPAAKVTRRGGGAAVPARPELLRGILPRCGLARIAVRRAGHGEVPHGSLRRLADPHPHRRGVRRGGRRVDRAACPHRAAALFGRSSLGSDR